MGLLGGSMDDLHAVGSRAAAAPSGRSSDPGPAPAGDAAAAAGGDSGGGGGGRGAQAPVKPEQPSPLLTADALPEHVRQQHHHGAVPVNGMNGTACVPQPVNGQCVPGSNGLVAAKAEPQDAKLLQQQQQQKAAMAAVPMPGAISSAN
jgi:hypothetical protein